MAVVAQLEIIATWKDQLHGVQKPETDFIREAHLLFLHIYSMV
jgi:hypothetical protein